MPHGKSPKHARNPRNKAARKKKAQAARSKGSAKAKARDTAAAMDGARASGSTAESVAPAAAARKSAARSRSSSSAFAGGAIRLQKLLAAAGFGSRRKVEQFLIDERVTVKGRVAKLGDRADPSVDEVRVDGERLARERPAYWILNKPRGVVTTVRDEEGRKTVMNLLPKSVGRLFPVGRLDRETTGLLLLTNDGDTAHALLHPSLGNEREYRVSVKGEIDDRTVARLEKGVVLEDGRTAPGRVSNIRFDADQGTSSFALTLVEGRKRQIRRSLLILGFPVRRLARVRMGPLRLGRLAVGEARPLRAEELRGLLKHVQNLRLSEGSAEPSRKRAARSGRAQRPTRSRKGVSK